MEIGTSTFFREREREERKKKKKEGRKEGKKEGRKKKEKTPVDIFSSFFKFCHPIAALPFAFLLGTMSKGNIKSYPLLQPTESKKYVILMSGERVWVIAYQEYSALQIKNLRMGKPSCSFHHVILLEKKTKQNSGL